jgi:hypothetical protein
MGQEFAVLKVAAHDPASGSHRYVVFEGVGAAGLACARA